MGWHNVGGDTGTEVFSGVPPSSFTSLDLSSYVGSNRAVVYIQASLTSSITTRRMAFRPPDDALNYMFLDSTYHGASYIWTGVDKAKGILCVTSVFGTIEWQSYFPGSDTASLRLMGYFLPEFGPVPLGDKFFLKNIWLTEDVSGVVGSNRSVGLTRYTRASGIQGAEEQIARPGQDTINWDGLASHYSGISHGGGTSTTDAEVVAFITGTDGRYGFRSNQAGGPDLEFNRKLLAAEATDYTHVDTEVFDKLPVFDTWTEEDISSLVPGRALVFFRIQSTNYTSTISFAIRGAGDTADWTAPPGPGPGGSNLASIVIQDHGRMICCQTDEDGKIEYWSDGGTGDDSYIKLDVIGYILENEQPTFTNKLPTGASEKPYVDVSFSIEDDNGVDGNTIDVTLNGPSGVFDAIIDGVFQDGWYGTIAANDSNGFDVVINDHPLFEDGAWQVYVECDDFLGATGDDLWGFISDWDPELVEIIPFSRRVAQVIWDLPVRCRDLSIMPPELTDRYTPVDWVAAGGQADDAQNSDLYSVIRPSGGFLNEPGKAVDLVAVKVDESADFFYDEGGVRYSERVDVMFDYQQTARCDYRMTIGVVSSPSEDSTGGDLDFIGFVVSQVPRNTLTFFGTLAEHHRRMDREGTEDLITFMSIWQEVMNRVLEDVDAFFWELCDIDKMRPEFLDNLLYDLGNPFAGIFDLTTNQKRKLAATLVQIYREKGTCKGIVNAVRFFVGVELSGCTDSWGTHWRLATGTSAAPISGTGGPYTLSDGPSSAPNPGSETPCYLAPSTDGDIWSFRVISLVTLTQEQRDKIEAIAEYMKPAATHYLGVIEP